MKVKFIILILLAVSREILSKPETEQLGLLEAEFDYVLETLVDDLKISFNPPTNDNNSIRYRLYTKESINLPCYIEPSVDQFDKCFFNTSLETKFLIPGFLVNLPPHNLIEDIKNTLLVNDFYNVIVVDWTLYNNYPFTMAYNDAKTVGIKVSELMKFIANYSGVSPETFHCIGHSLGAHVCGLAGRFTPNLGRITGLDPGGLSKVKSLKPNIRLQHTDANFVDVIHTSDFHTGIGLGYLDPTGDMDFYPNGGYLQRHCETGRYYSTFEGRILKIQTNTDKTLCNHLISLAYFRNSILDNCRFIATRCGNFSSYRQNMCSPDDNPITAEMGLPSKKIPGLPPKSKFYLETLALPPYCN